MSVIDRPIDIAVDFVSNAIEATVEGKLHWADAGEESGFHMPEGGGWWQPRYHLRGDGMDLYVGLYGGDAICAVMENGQLVSFLSNDEVEGVETLLKVAGMTTKSRKLDRAFKAFGFKRAS